MPSSIFSDMIEGVIILAILCGIYGLSNDVLSLAGLAQKDGILSLVELTNSLTNSQ